MRRAHRVAAAALAASAAACAGVPDDPGWAEFAGALHDELARGPAIPDARAGAFAPGDGASIESGDRVVYALELHDRSGMRRWFLEVELVSPPIRTVRTADGRTLELAGLSITEDLAIQFKSKGGEPMVLRSQTRPARVTVRDAGGEVVGETEVAAPVDFLARGFFPAIDAVVDGAGPREDWVGGIATLIAMARICQHNEVLADVLWKVVDKPGLLSVLWEWGVHLQLDVAFEAATPIAGSTAEPGRTAQFPLELEVNGAPAIRCSLRATEPRGALGLAAGVTSVVGFKPTDREVRFRLVLIAAERKGEPGAAIRPELDAPSMRQAALRPKSFGPPVQKFAR